MKVDEKNLFVCYRIRLNVSNTDEDSNDYINASKVEAPLDHKTYILTQGPLEHTVGDFWTMVWQQQVSAIVMLCRLMEQGICKCARYWPATDDEDDLIRVNGRGLEVRLRDFDNSDSDFIVRPVYSFWDFFLLVQVWQRKVTSSLHLFFASSSVLIFTFSAHIQCSLRIQDGT